MKLEDGIRKRIMRAFNLSISRMKALENMAIAAGSFTLSLAIPLIFKIDKVFIISIMVALLIHELGHFYALKYFKYENRRIIFFFLVAVTTTASAIESRFHRIIISLAGPVPGILLGSLMLLFWRYFPDDLRYFAYLLVVINTFNLIPVAILDGGNIFESLFVPDSNNKIGIFNIITGSGSLIFCFFNNDFFILWLPVIIILRGIVFLRHRKESSIIQLKGIITLKQKAILTTTWFSTLIIGMFSML